MKGFRFHVSSFRLQGTIVQWFKQCKKTLTQRGSLEGAAYPLSIDGIPPAPLTPEPDDAELAAASLLASYTGFKVQGSGFKMFKKKDNHESLTINREPAKDAAYYQQMSDKIKAAHRQEARAAMRFVAWCEGNLRGGTEQRNNKTTESVNSEIRETVNPFTELEAGLFKHQDVVEREGGDLKKRWQHCLATVTVLQMQKYQLSTQ